VARSTALHVVSSITKHPGSIVEAREPGEGLRYSQMSCCRGVVVLIQDLLAPPGRNALFLLFAGLYSANGGCVGIVVDCV